ncbi:nucleotidyltransferase domain-containing protein [Candidatus Micrarchaeota archaeon]|nr:nucleotidyltransferase domain-containing protein [Candidatus Micrarchaeota archaeon]
MKQIKEITDRLKGMKDVKAVILFGSYVKGRQRKDSDLDLCVITDSETDKPLELSGEKIDISIFDKLPLTFRYRVFKDGKILFNKDERLLTKLRFWTITNYLDGKYWRDRLVARVLS